MACLYRKLLGFSVIRRSAHSRMRLSVGQAKRLEKHVSNRNPRTNLSSSPWAPATSSTSAVFDRPRFEMARLIKPLAQTRKTKSSQLTCPQRWIVYLRAHHKETGCDALRCIHD